MSILFWLSVTVIFYVYLGYPLIVYIMSLYAKNPIKRKYVYPMVSVILTIHNDERDVENKILSLLHLDYPSERLEILIGSDGATERTRQLITQYLSDKVRLHHQPAPEGKPAMLNRLAAMAKGEILMFTDAQHRFDKDFLKELVRNFSDEKVGCVSVDLLFGNVNDKSSQGFGIYWKYERFIRKCESKIGSMLGGTDSTYAIKKELFPELPHDLILDDVFIPLKITQQGYRAIFEHKAKFYDKAKRDVRNEFRRKVRNLAGNFQLVGYLKKIMTPFKAKVAWQFFSHKILRLAVPCFLLTALASTLALSEQPLYRVMAAAQMLFYFLALAGATFRHKSRLFDIPYMFCAMNAAVLVGLYRFVVDRQNIIWERIEENLHEETRPV